LSITIPDHLVLQAITLEDELLFAYQAIDHGAKVSNLVDIRLLKGASIVCNLVSIAIKKRQTL